MNFDDNDEQRRAINYESDDQRLAPGVHGQGLANINPNDVLCGRGKTSFNHVGNRRFRHIISESIEDYNNAGSRKAKSAVVKKVHDNIRATGGRFLKLDTAHHSWVELSQQRSLEKVSHAIRDATSTNENMKKKKKQVHSTIAQVAAHVTSRFPSVHLEGKLDDDNSDDEERLAFKSVESLHMTLPTLPVTAPVVASTTFGPSGNDNSSRSASARLGSAMHEEETPMPPLHHPRHRLREEPEEGITMPMLQTSTSNTTKLQFPEDNLQPQQVHHHNRRALLLGAEEQEEHHSHIARSSSAAQQQLATPQGVANHGVPRHEDDFLSYINEVLGPVSPTDLDIDPLKKLAPAKRKKED